MSGIAVLSTLNVLTLLLLGLMKYILLFLFICEETEARRGERTCPRSHS